MATYNYREKATSTAPSLDTANRVDDQSDSPITWTTKTPIGSRSMKLRHSYIRASNYRHFLHTSLDHQGLLCNLHQPLTIEVATVAIRAQQFLFLIIIQPLRFDNNTDSEKTNPDIRYRAWGREKGIGKTILATRYQTQP
jgi:hypothetical protein